MSEYAMLCPACGGLPVDDGPVCETCGRGVHHRTVRELAAAMRDLEASGARVRISTSAVGRWQAACAHGHDGIVDNTELRHAREKLGDEVCAAVYEDERARLRGAK